MSNIIISNTKVTFLKLTAMKPLRNNVYAIYKQLKFVVQTVENLRYYYKSYFYKVNYHETIKNNVTAIYH